MAPYQNIALALDFGTKDNVVIANALKYVHANTHLVLIHVVESAGAKILGKELNDYESNEDLANLKSYQNLLIEKGIHVSYELGYRNRISEIVRICNEQKIDMLIMGAHGHKGVFDFIYGHTIDAVRHQLNIPVLIVK